MANTVQGKRTEKCRLRASPGRLALWTLMLCLTACASDREFADSLGDPWRWDQAPPARFEPQPERERQLLQSPQPRTPLVYGVHRSPADQGYDPLAGERPLPDQVSITTLPEYPAIYGLQMRVAPPQSPAGVDARVEAPRPTFQPSDAVPPAVVLSVQETYGYVEYDRAQTLDSIPPPVTESSAAVQVRPPGRPHVSTPVRPPVRDRQGATDLPPLQLPPPIRPWSPPESPVDPDSTLMLGGTGASVFPGPQQRTRSVPTEVSVWTPQPDAPIVTGSATPFGPMVLGAGDVITVSVFNRPELTTTAAVSEQGRVMLPLIGEIALSGLAPAQASTRVANAYENAELLTNPQVNIVVTEYRSQQISVLGEVQNPGRFSVETRLTVLDALALARGVTALGGDQVQILRPFGGRVGRYEIDLSELLDGSGQRPLFDVRAGDTVIVPKAETFYIYGEVQQPDAYRLKPGMTVIQALSIGGGLTERGTDKRIEIKRRMANGALASVEAALNTPIQPDDVIYVRERLF